MKKVYFALIFALLLTACAPADSAEPPPAAAETTTTTAATTTVATTTTEEKEKYIGNLYDINYTTKKIHRSGCDHLLTDTGQDFEIMIKEISRDLIDKKHFSTCGYCNPELPKKEEKSLEMTDLYLEFFSEYAFNVGEVAPGAVREKLSKHPDYKVEYEKGSKDTLQTYTITDTSGDYIYMVFYPRYKGDTIEGLTSLTYHSGDKEITITDDTHISELKYFTYDKNRKTKSKEVNGLGDLEEFMFANSEK